MNAMVFRGCVSRSVLGVSMLAIFLAVCARGTLAAASSSLAGDKIPLAGSELTVHPINHATFALGWNGKVILVDPVGGAKRFEGLPRPDLILITDIHGDHLDLATLTSLATNETLLIASKAAAEKLPENLAGKTSILNNGDSKTVLGFQVAAIPAYNTSPERLNYHPKGRGNGYLLTVGDARVYISGDTEDVPEMRALKNVDVAFVCMNLPYTMTVEQAADAVRTFKPKIVYPYHSRGSDLQKFKQLVGTDSGVDVRLRDWYK
jgi:L-ascorbate metabolism protein UlaG (beta-lactamase superfamily)